MNDPEDLSLFMICRAVNAAAFRNLPDAYSIRKCRSSEIEFWKAMHFDDPREFEQHSAFMAEFFEKVYAPRIDEFLRSCVFVCDPADHPVATAFLWKICDSFWTLHWFKVRKEFENRGIGRGLLSYLLANPGEDRLPLYLHTQAGSFRAIKLYSDFGFDLIIDPLIGSRPNQLSIARPYLQDKMPAREFARLRETRAPREFLDRLALGPDDQF